MGKVLGSVGNFVGSLGGGLAGGVAESAGATNKTRASNPYFDPIAQEELRRRADIYSKQQSLAQALELQRSGGGPNPEQFQYLGNVGNNIANAQGLIASQRGLNPALAARIGANVASDENQKAALGSALLQQQRQLDATKGLASLYGGLQSDALNQQQLYNQAALGTQNLASNIAAGNAGIRGQLVGGLVNAGAAAAGAGAYDGGLIAGEPNVNKNSPQNDTVDLKVSPGEAVIDLEHMKNRRLAYKRVDELFDEKEKQESMQNDFIKYLSNRADTDEPSYTKVLKARKRKA